MGLIFDLGPLGAYDKLAHFTYFLLLTLVLMRGLGLPLLWALGLAVALGICGELVQGLLPRHETSLRDMVANLAGIAAALAMVSGPLLRSKRPSPTSRS